MTKTQTVDIICAAAKKLFAERGYDGLSMRRLTTISGVGLSSIYHFFEDKDVLLKEVYLRTNSFLGQQRLQLKKRSTVELMLQDRITFQFEYIEDVVFVLKYYLQFRRQFLELPTKVLPPKAYLHIEEVLRRGVAENVFTFRAEELETQARIITHSINGFLLEYYPMTLGSVDRKKLVSDLTEFTMRSLTYKEVPM